MTFKKGAPPWNKGLKRWCKTARKTKKIEFYVNENGCHICTSHTKDSSGYPRMRRVGKKISLSRYLWIEKYGSIAPGLCMCHKCDNPGCINLDHLFLGTHSENMKDRNKKERHAFGERAGNVKLNSLEVVEIFNATGLCVDIASKYNVALQTVLDIKSGKTWSKITKKAA